MKHLGNHAFHLNATIFSTISILLSPEYLLTVFVYSIINSSSFCRGLDLITRAESIISLSSTVFARIPILAESADRYFAIYICKCETTTVVDVVAAVDYNIVGTHKTIGTQKE